MAKLNYSDSVVYSVEEHVTLLLRAMDELDIKIHNAYGSSFVMPRERTFLTREAAGKYINELNGRPEFRAMADDPYPYIEIVQSFYADRVGMYMKGKVYLSDIDDGGDLRKYRQLFLLHEFAHYAGGGSGHGERFRQAFIKIVSMEMGEELGRYFQIRFHEEQQEAERLKGK